MITKRAFSRTANLGQLYDANNDTLLPANILNLNNSSIISNAICKNANEYIEHDFLYAYTNDDQFSHLEIDSNLRLNLYAGLVDIGGSGRYLLSGKSAESAIKGSFYYKIVKEDDELMIENLWADAISNDSLDDLFNIPVLFGELSKSATHILVKRQFGADLFFTFESKKGDKSMLKKIESRVQVAMSELVSVDGGVSLEKSSGTSYEDIHVSFYGDSKPPSKYKGTVESVLECLQEIGYMTTEPKQMKWILYPIEHLSKLQEILKTKQSTINSQWTKLGYVIEPANYICKELDLPTHKLLFYYWDMLLKNKNILDTLDKQIHNNDLSAYRLIIKKIKEKQMEINGFYETNIIEQVRQSKRANKPLDIEQLTQCINEINGSIEKYLNGLGRINLNLSGKPNVLTKSKLENLIGNNYVYFINRDYIQLDEHKAMCELIAHTQNSYLPTQYHYFCNHCCTEEPIEIEKNLVRYINLCQVNNSIPKNQRWLHINNIQVFDDTNKPIPLYSQYIKIRYSSKSEEWSTGNVISDDSTTFFHTSNGENEWIEIDLGKNIRLSKIILTNRLDCGNPHDNIVRLTGCKLSLWNDFSDFNNRILVSQATITARAYEYEFPIGVTGILDSSDYLVVRPKKHNDFHKIMYNNTKEIELFMTEALSNEEKINKNKTKETGLFNCAVNLQDDTELKMDMKGFRLPAYGFEWSGNVVKITGQNISHRVKFDSDNLLLPYYVTDNIKIAIESNNLNNIYKLWNNVVISQHKNQIMWYPESEVKTISTSDGKYLHDLFMPCPHDYRGITCDNQNQDHKNWVCYICNSIAKIRKVKTCWYFNCYECDKVVKLSDCYFMCNEDSHGSESYKFNNLFNCDNSKFNYVMGCYSFKSGLCCLEKINLEKHVIKYEQSGFFGKKAFESTGFYSYSPFTILDSKDYSHNYISVDLTNPIYSEKGDFTNYIGYLFLFDDNKFKVHQEIIMDDSHRKRLSKTVSVNFKNNNDLSNDQMVPDAKWVNQKHNFSVEFIKENKVCKINGNEYTYININPFTCVVIYEKDKIFTKPNYKWFFMLNTHLDKITAILLKNNSFKFYSVLTR